MLRDSGQVRVSTVAAELGIARSTAHRLLAMLVYRDFAVQAEDRSYRPGPALSAELLRGANGRPPEGMTAAGRRALVSELRLVRDQGYAENIEESESGVCAIGLCLRDKTGDPVAALSVSAPSVRYTPDRSRMFLTELRTTVAKAQADIS